MTLRLVAFAQFGQELKNINFHFSYVQALQETFIYFYLHGVQVIIIDCVQLAICGGGHVPIRAPTYERENST